MQENRSMHWQVSLLTDGYAQTLLHILGIMKVWDFLPQNITPKHQLSIYFVTSRQNWLGIAKLKNVFRSIIDPSTNLI